MCVGRPGHPESPEEGAGRVVSVASVPAYRRVADEIQSRIMSGELSGGDRLSESELVESFGIGRSTAREALRLLASRHLVVTSRGVTGGTFVDHPRLNEVREDLERSLLLLSMSEHISVTALIEGRIALEIPAAELASSRRTIADCELMESFLFNPSTVDSEAAFACNRDFHAAILEAAKSPLLGILSRPVFSVLQQRFSRDEAPLSFWRMVDRDHRDIIKHIRARDSEEAAAASRRHLRHLRKTYIAIDRDRLRMRDSDSAPG